MYWLKGLRLRARALAHPARAAQELDDEIHFHLEHEAAKYVSRGHSPAEAERRALLAFGGVARTHEEHRDVRVVPWLADAIADARFALRSLKRAPIMACAAILTLSLGIGAATAIYSVVSAVVLRPLPFPNGERLFVIGEENAERGWHMQDAAPANYLDWKTQIPAFAQGCSSTCAIHTAIISDSRTMLPCDCRATRRR